MTKYYAYTESGELYRNPKTGHRKILHVECDKCGEIASPGEELEDWEKRGFIDAFDLDLVFEYDYCPRCK